LGAALKLRQLLISKDKKFVYHYIPRAGASSLKYHLQDYLEGMIRVEKENVEVRNSPLHANTAKVQRSSLDLPQYEDYFKFIVVRNPYDRIISYYYEYITSNTAHFRHPISNIRIDTFDKYIDALQSIKSWGPEHDHLMPICLMAMPLFMYDRVYKLEQGCFSDISKDLKVKDFENIRFSVSSRSGEQESMTKDQIDRVVKTAEMIYTQDLYEFEYNRQSSKYLEKFDAIS
jgi:hypothetical protein